MFSKYCTRHVKFLRKKISANVLLGFKNLLSFELEMPFFFSSPEPKAHKVSLHSIPIVRCPSVVIHTFKLEYLWSQLANLDQSLCVSLGWEKGWLRFLCRLDKNSGFQGNRNCPLTYNGENHVSIFSLLVLIRSLSNSQVTRTGIKSRTSSNFGQIGLLPMELGGLECLKISHRLTWIMGKWCCQASSFIFYLIFVKLVTRTGIKSRTSSNSGWIGSVTSELHSFEGGLNFQ